MHCSGLRTAEEFERMLLERFRQPVLTKGQWSRHMRGDVAPQGAKSGKGKSLIAYVAQIYSGTVRTYYHPVWRLLDFDVLLGPQELQQISFELDDVARSLFHFDQNDCTEGTSPEQLRFWRWSADLDKVSRSKNLSPFGGLTGVAVGLIEARMSYLAQSPNDFAFYMHYAAHCLRHCPMFEPFWEGSKGRSVLLTMEGMCVLHAARMLAHLPGKQQMEPKGIHQPSQKDQLNSLLAIWYESWAEECLAHVRTLTPKALRTFQIWNGDVIRYQGLLRWPEFNTLG